jgi:hypothetical protein
MLERGVLLGVEDAALRALLPELRRAVLFFAGFRFAAVRLAGLRLAAVRLAAVFFPPRRAAAFDGLRRPVALFEERLDDFDLRLDEDFFLAAIRFLLL